MKRLNINISDEMHEWLVKDAKSRGLTLNAVVIFALEDVYRRREVTPNLGEIMKALEFYRQSGTEKKAE